MSRMSGGGDQIFVKPSNNVYTVLAAVGVIIEIAAFTLLWLKHTELFNTNLFPGH